MSKASGSGSSGPDRPGTGRHRRADGLDLRLVGPAASAWCSAAVLVALPAGAAVAAGVLWAAAVVLVAGAVLAGRRAGRVRSRAAPTSASLSSGALSSGSLSSGSLSSGSALGRLGGTLALCCAAAALAGTSVAVQAPARMPEAVRDAVAEHGEVDALLTVWSAPVASSTTAIGGASQVRFRATLISLQGSGGERPGPEDRRLSVPVVVFTTADVSAPDIGDEIGLTGTLIATEPGDAASALLFGRGRVDQLRPAPWWLDWANGLRERFASAADGLPGEGAGLLPGLAIGDTTGVGTDLDAAMKTSSLSHLTAVSGDSAPNRGETEIAKQVRAMGPIWGPRSVRSVAAFIAKPTGEPCTTLLPECIA